MLRITIALLAGLMLIPSASAQGLLYSALLDGPSENPPNASPGTGVATVLVNTTSHIWHLHVDFSGLTGTTTNSHIHSPAIPPANAGVATTVPTFAGFPSGVTAGTFDVDLDMSLAGSFNPTYITNNGGTPASAELALAASINAGTAYWNIHTNLFPGGEIRGFLTAVPEPTTVAMIGVVLGGAALYEIRHRRKNRAARFAKV